MLLSNYEIHLNINVSRGLYYYYIIVNIRNIIVNIIVTWSITAKIRDSSVIAV